MANFKVRKYFGKTTISKYDNFCIWVNNKKSFFKKNLHLFNTNKNRSKKLYVRYKYFTFRNLLERFIYNAKYFQSFIGGEMAIFFCQKFAPQYKKLLGILSVSHAVLNCCLAGSFLQLFLGHCKFKSVSQIHCYSN